MEYLLTEELSCAPENECHLACPVLRKQPQWNHTCICNHRRRRADLIPPLQVISLSTHTVQRRLAHPAPLIGQIRIQGTRARWAAQGRGAILRICCIFSFHTELGYQGTDGFQECSQVWIQPYLPTTYHVLLKSTQNWRAGQGQWVGQNYGAVFCAAVSFSSASDLRGPLDCCLP